MRKKLKLRYEYGDSGSNKRKWSYVGAYCGVWRGLSLRVSGVRQSGHSSKNSVLVRHHTSTVRSIWYIEQVDVTLTPVRRPGYCLSWKGVRDFTRSNNTSPTSDNHLPTFWLCDIKRLRLKFTLRVLKVPSSIHRPKSNNLTKVSLSRSSQNFVVFIKHITTTKSPNPSYLFINIWPNTSSNIV